MITHTLTCHAFAELLAERCSVADLDKKVWADAIGVSEKNWSKYTRGETLPNDATFATVASKLFKMDPEALVEMLCERMSHIARRGIVRNAAGRFVPADPGDPDEGAPYAVAGNVLELAEPTPADHPRPSSIDLFGLSPESADLLRATHAWLAARDAERRA